MKSGIYIITCVSNSKVYIGSATDLVNRRRSGHFECAAHNDMFERAMLKYGKENFTWNILEYCEIYELKEREQHYFDTMIFAKEYIISKHKDRRFRELSYNIDPIAKNRTGHEVSLETRDKISKAQVGTTRKRSSVEKMINTKKTNGTGVRKEETKQKISKSNLGKPKSEAHKQAMIKGNTNKQRPVLQYNDNGIFMRECTSMIHCGKLLEEETGIPENCWQIFHCCSGLANFSYWLTFRYKESDNYPLKIDVPKRRLQKVSKHLPNQ